VAISKSNVFVSNSISRLVKWLNWFAKNSIWGWFCALQKWMLHNNASAPSSNIFWLKTEHHVVAPFAGQPLIFFFPKLNNVLKGHRFHDAWFEIIKQNLTKTLTSNSKNNFEKYFQQWQKLSANNKCVAVKGTYFEEHWTSNWSQIWVLYLIYNHINLWILWIIFLFFFYLTPFAQLFSFVLILFW